MKQEPSSKQRLAAGFGADADNEIERGALVGSDMLPKRKMLSTKYNMQLKISIKPNKHQNKINKLPSALLLAPSLLPSKKNKGALVRKF